MYACESPIKVITRNGVAEELNLSKITDRIQSLINMEPRIEHVSASYLTLIVCNNIKNEISTYEIDEYSANAAASLSIGNPHYLKVAGRIAIDNHQKNTLRNFVDKMAIAYRNKAGGVFNPLLNERFYKFAEKHHEFIDSIIDYKRDFLLDFF